MENKIKNLKKECPICGAVIDAGLDYCPKCDSYVGDIVPLDDQENDQKISSEGSSSEGDFGSNSSTNKGFEELDTILSDSQESQSKITIHELQQLLASNGQTVDNSVEPLTSTSQKKEEIDSNQNYAGDTGRPPKRNELRKKKRRGLLSNSKSVDANTKQEDELENDHDFDRYSSVDEIKDLNAPEKIIINTQVEEEVDEPEDFKSNRSKPEKKIHQTASKDNIFQEFLEFIIKSLKAPSLKTTSNDFLMGIISLVIEFIFFAFSLQLLYNSGFQMSAKGNDKAFGQYLIHALDPNNKHNILGLMLVLFLVFLLIPLLGIFCDKFLIRDRDFSIKSFIAQFSRYSISLLPISVLAFVYSLFNNPFVTKLTLILLCLAPVILILASSLYLLQARGQVLFDRVYIISLYFAVSMIVSYLLVHPYFISFAKSFTTFLG